MRPGVARRAVADPESREGSRRRSNRELVVLGDLAAVDQRRAIAGDAHLDAAPVRLADRIPRPGALRRLRTPRLRERQQQVGRYLRARVVLVEAEEHAPVADGARTFTFGFPAGHVDDGF